MKVEELLVAINSIHHTELAVSRKLQGGYQGGGHLLTEPGGRSLVLKCGYAEYAVKAVSRLRAVGYPVPPVRYSGVTENGVRYWIEEFVPGTPMGELQVQYVDQVLSLNSLQADLATGIDPDPDQNWSQYAHAVVFADESGWRELIGGLSVRTRALLEVIDEGTKPFAGENLPETDLVHGDFIPDNILVHDGTVVAVIDNTHFGRGTRAIDLAALIHYSRLYGYSAVVQNRLVQEAKSMSPPPGVLAVCLSYRVMAMLAWVITRDAEGVIQHHAEVGMELVTRFSQF
jgi:aminoglycoside phosphotransferase (APT) family kinase protein